MKFPWSPQCANEEAILAQRKNFRAIIKHLKANASNALPSFLLLGDTQAGKTALLRESGLTFTQIIPTPNTHTHERFFTDSKSCTGLFSDHGLYIDVPGKLFDKPEKKSVWLDLLRSLKRLQGYSPLSAVILVIELPALLSQNESSLPKLKQYLLEVSQHLKSRCPLIIIFSKCDRIVGFEEFFSHLSAFERAQHWGCDLETTGVVTTHFKQQYAELLLQLRQQLNQQLHYENKPQRRSAIFAFPSQMEMLQTPLAQLLYELCDMASYSEKLPVQGIFFTSTKQFATDEQRLDLLATQLRPSLGLITAITVNPALENAPLSQAYFIAELFGNYLPSLAKSCKKQLKKTYWLKTSIYATALTVVIIGALWAGTFYKQQLDLLNSAQSALSRYQALTTLAADDSLTRKDAALITHKATLNLQALAALSQANSLLSQLKLTWLSYFGAKDVALNLAGYTQQTLQHALQQTFGPQLKSCLEHELLVTGTDPDKVYTQLKTYLMLAEPKHRQTQQLSKAITTCWQGELNHLSAARLAANHLSSVTLPANLTMTLAQTLPPIALNRAVITFSRNQLQNLQPSLLAYIILKDQAMPDQALSLPLMQQMSNVTASFGNLLFAPRKINPIPSLYTAAGFQQVFSGQLQAAVHTATTGNWVLGNKIKPTADTLDTDLVLQQVSELYLNDYANWWDTSLAAFEIIKIKDIQHAAAILKRLSQTDSLQQLLQLVAANTSPTALLATLPKDSPTLDATMRSQIQAILGNRFQSLAAWTQEPPKNYAEMRGQVQKKIHNLYTFIDKIAADKNPALATFNATATYLEMPANAHPLTDMLQQIKQTPMPLQRWLQDITNNIWGVLAASSKKTLNNAWQTEVLPYSNTLKNCYPLNKNVATDCRLADFSHFFAPAGILADYFNHYLKPFIDTSKPDWSWRNKEGLELHLADNLLPLFVRARIISKMYFPPNSNQLDVAFTLQPITFAPTVSRFRLTLNNQSLQDQPGVDTITSLHWPGKGTHEKTSFSFSTTTANNDIITTLQGPWAWFRLLDTLQLLPTSNPKRYIIVFQNKDDFSKYQLLAKETVNPFIGNVIDQFQCPETL